MSDSQAVQHGVKFTELAGKAMAAASQLIDSFDKEAASVEPKVAAMITRCIQAGFLPKSQEKQARQMARTHAGALDITLNLLDMMQTKMAAVQTKLDAQMRKEAGLRLGRPEQADNRPSEIEDAREKRASMTAGYRRGDDDYADEATLALARGLGVQLGRG